MLGKVFNKAKELGSKGLHEAQRKTAVDVLNKTQNKVSGKSKDVLDKARVLVVNKYDKGSAIKMPNLEQRKKSVDSFSEQELKNWLAKNYGFRGVDGKGITKNKEDRSIINMRKEVLNQMDYVDKNIYAKGSAVRANKSPLLKYANFEDNWHINLVKLNPNKNQDGLLYKGGNKYAAIRTSDKGYQQVFEFKTLEQAENKFNKLVMESKKYSPISKEGKVEGNYAKGGAMTKKLGVGGRVTNINDAIATSDLKDELRSKMKKGDDVIHFAFTDYGGDFMDKVAVEYFEENYPKNTLSETTAYYGKNAFVFGKPATEWIEASEDYPLGFEDFESYYYEKQNEQENEDFERFLDDLKRDGYEVSDEAIVWLNENRSGYYGMTTQGLDFSYEDLTDDLKEEGLITKDEMAEGGATKGFNYSIGGL